MPFAVARDGYLFKALGEVHPVFHTPALALVIQGVVAIVLCAGRSVPRAIFTGDICGVAFLHGGGKYDFCVSQERTERCPSLPNSGLSGGARVIHRDSGGSSLLHLREQSAGFGRGRDRHPAGHSRLLVVRRRQAKSSS